MAWPLPDLPPNGPATTTSRSAGVKETQWIEDFRVFNEAARTEMSDMRDRLVAAETEIIALGGTGTVGGGGSIAPSYLSGTPFNTGNWQQAITVNLSLPVSGPTYNNTLMIATMSIDPITSETMVTPAGWTLIYTFPGSSATLLSNVYACRYNSTTHGSTVPMQTTGGTAHTTKASASVLAYSGCNGTTLLSDALVDIGSGIYIRETHLSGPGAASTYTRTVPGINLATLGVTEACTFLVLGAQHANMTNPQVTGQGIAASGTFLGASDDISQFKPGAASTVTYAGHRSSILQGSAAGEWTISADTVTPSIGDGWIGIIGIRGT